MPVSKNLELAQLANGLDINQSTGEVVTINLDTDAVSEGTTNLYLTNFYHVVCQPFLNLLLGINCLFF